MDLTVLDRLIVESLGDLDPVAKRIVEIEARVWSEIADLMSDWAKKKGWNGGYDIEDDLWVAPNDWFVDEERDTWLWLTWGPGDTGLGTGQEVYFDLSRLAGIGGGRLCLWLDWKGIGARSWKPKAREAADGLSRWDFKLDDKASIYIDCTPAPGAIAAGLENDDLSEALKPIESALERAAEAKTLLDRLLMDARKV